MSYDDYCSICGLAITKQEASADIRGEFTLFNERSIGTIQMTLCEDCTNKIIEISMGGMEPALKKRANKDEVDAAHGRKFMRNKMKRDDDDKDDGSGGVKSVLPP